MINVAACEGSIASRRGWRVFPTEDATSVGPGARCRKRGRCRWGRCQCIGVTQAEPLHEREARPLHGGVALVACDLLGNFGVGAGVRIGIDQACGVIVARNPIIFTSEQSNR